MRCHLLIGLIFIASSAFAESPADYAALRGTATLGNVGDHEIGVLVKPDSGQSAHVFRLWCGDAVQPFRVTLTSASVEFRGNELVIIDGEQQKFFTLRLTSAPPGPQIPAGFSGARFDGYGLNHQIYPASSRTGRIISDDGFDEYVGGPDVQTEVDWSGTGGTTCNSGGAGASSCSWGDSGGSCSVTCTGRTYACCKKSGLATPPSCTCVAY